MVDEEGRLQLGRRISQLHVISPFKKIWHALINVGLWKQLYRYVMTNGATSIAIS